MKVSFVTLVNNEEVYAANILSTIPNYNGIEFVPIFFPNTATSGLNQGIDKAKNDIIVLCHQDVRFSENWIDKLANQICLINDDNFGVLGTWGVSFDGMNGVGNIKSGDKYVEEIRGVTTGSFSPTLPQQVMSLDEHCLIIRKDSKLRFDEKLTLFHFYGADLCLSAYNQGMKCYAIDAFLHHLSDNNNREGDFTEAEEWFIKKWRGHSPFKRFRTSCRIRIDL